MRTLLPLVIILIAFWFLLIRPQRKRQAALQAQRSELAPGADVMLSSGIFGTVRDVTDDHILVEIADGVTVRVVRAAIGSVIPKDEPTDAVDDPDAVDHPDAADDADDADDADGPDAVAEDTTDGPVDLSKPEES